MAMSKTNIFDNIRNVLDRIEEIKRTFGTKGAAIQGEFENRLQDKLSSIRPSGASGEVKAAGGTKDSGGTDAGGVTYPVRGNAGGGAGPISDAVPHAMDGVIKTASERFKIPESLIRAVIQQESGFNLDAVSNKGAMGLMQLMPGTADALGVSDPFNLEENVFGGTKYLRDMINLYGGNLNEALAAYNAGPDRVRNGVPDIRETKEFVESVLDHYEKISSENFSKPNTEEEF
jgi:hypothetical protein